jgi:hypothetical protein
MNPAITCSGTVPNGTPKMYITRKVTALLPAGTSTSSVTATPAALGVADGAKILSLKAYSLRNRTLTIDVPNGSVIVVNDGSSTAPFGGFKKTVAAPLSRFPVIKMNIPDLLAAPLNSDSTETLFSLSSEGIDDLYRVVYTAKYLA